jgi:DNA-binding NtrC family response regulator
MKILLIEDEKITRITLSDTLRDEGHSVDTAEDGLAGKGLLTAKHYDVIISDLKLPGFTGLELLDLAKKESPETEFIIMTAYASVETAISAIKKGAYDYITKPFHPDELINMIQRIENYQKIFRENIKLKKIIGGGRKRELIGTTEVMIRLKQTLELIAKRDYTVLITGESGTGKELVAREIHRLSGRSDRPFLAVNCAVIPENLLESELFGHEKGAFSGAIKHHKGYFERAGGGILFIDDIDDFPLPMQVKLLRVLQEKEFNRVGGSELIRADVRILAATKESLEEKVRRGEFREDLFYRLNIIPLSLPPLRERKEDIPLLLNYFFEKHGSQMRVRDLPEEVREELLAYNWPGNVRELENVAQRLIALPEIKPLQLNSAPSEDKNLPVSGKPQIPPSFEGYKPYLHETEKKLILSALNQCDNNISDAARLLKIPRSTLRSRMESLGILSR